jgi:hypothetical protein
MKTEVFILSRLKVNLDRFPAWHRLVKASISCPVLETLHKILMPALVPEECKSWNNRENPIFPLVIRLWPAMSGF